MKPECITSWAFWAAGCCVQVEHQLMISFQNSKSLKRLLCQNALVACWFAPQSFKELFSVRWMTIVSTGSSIQACAKSHASPRFWLTEIMRSPFWMAFLVKFSRNPRPKSIHPKQTHHLVPGISIIGMLLPQMFYLPYLKSKTTKSINKPLHSTIEAKLLRIGLIPFRCQATFTN